MSDQQGYGYPVPSAQVPGARVQPADAQDAEGSAAYEDSNINARGDVLANRPQVHPDDPATLDTELDTSPRTDGTGEPASDPEVGDPPAGVSD